MGLNETPMKQTQTKKIKSAARKLSAKLKTARGRKLSSTRWLKRQINDPYVLEAKRVGYRSRSAWKLAQLDDRLKFLKKTNRILDLGAAPGGWTQVVLERAVYTEKVVAVDISNMIPISGVEILQLDMSGSDVIPKVLLALGGKADVWQDLYGHRTRHLPDRWRWQDCAGLAQGESAGPCGRCARGCPSPLSQLAPAAPTL